MALSSCDSDSGIGGNFNSYEQADLLNNLGNNLIIEAYTNLNEASSSLKSATASFTSELTAQSLVDLRDQLRQTRLAWQACTPYSFGPASDLGLASNLNIYPIDQTQIERNIASGNYDLNALSNNDAKGFQSIGYLINRTGLSNEEIIDSFDTNRITYLTEVVELIQVTTQNVLNTWNNDYLQVFTSEDARGIDAGSSLGLLVNALNREFERNTRDGKVGIPVGIRSLGEPFPEATEAYFSGYSVALLSENIEAFEQLFKGNEGEGLDDYLNAISAVTSSNTQLTTEINNQFVAIESAIGQISDPLPASIESQKADVELVFAEMQKLVVLFKTDMASALGVIITYQDSDGD